MTNHFSRIVTCFSNWGFGLFACIAGFSICYVLVYLLDFSFLEQNESIPAFLSIPVLFGILGFGIGIVVNLVRAFITWDEKRDVSSLIFPPKWALIGAFLLGFVGVFLEMPFEGIFFFSGIAVYSCWITIINIDPVYMLLQKEDK